MSHDPTPRRSRAWSEGEAVRITVVVLGAGKSSRFGEPKQLLPFGETTLLGASVANASNLDRVVVLGKASEEARNSVDFGRAEVVEDTAYGTGCASSLLADQPGVRPEYINRAISEWRSERPWASACSYAGRSEPQTRGEPIPDPRVPLGHPVIFDREAFGELRSLHGDKAERVRWIGVAAVLPPDVDTPEDYEAALARWRGDGE